MSMFAFRTQKTDASLVGSVTGDVTLDLIPQDVDIEIGDLVLTSGLGGGYPPDLIVGQVVNVRSRDFDLFQQATVQPVVDFNHLADRAGDRQFQAGGYYLR